jgi:Probable N6-adenine methyltransferase
MEQVQPSRGPYETLYDDPASLRSPEPTPSETFMDIQKNIQIVNSSHVLEGEELAYALKSLDEATTHLIADEAAIAAGAGGRVACIACPGVYISLKKGHPEHANDLLMDFDPRFKVSLKGI